MKPNPQTYKPALWLGWFLASNILLLCLMAQQYLWYGSAPDSLAALVYWVLQVIGHFSFLAILLYLPLLLIALLLPLHRFIMPLSILAYTLLLLLIQVDIQVFALYRFHLNTVIWGFLTTPGAAAEIFVFDPVNYASALTLVLGLLATEYALALLVHRYLNRHWVSDHRLLSGRRIVAALLAVMFAGQSWHVIADSRHDGKILAMVGLIPWAQGITARGLLQRYGLAQHSGDFQPATNGQLRYPRNDLQCDGPDQDLNFLFVVLDGFRFDMLNPEVTPNLFELAAESQQFNQHISSGNSTRYGIFGLFSGILGNYWQAGLRSNAGSVLIDQFLAQQYEIGIFSNARLTSPEFDRTVFSSIRDRLPESTPGNTVVEREYEINRQFKQFIAQPKSTPFMSLVFYDAPHAFAFPSDMDAPFKPWLKQINYLALNRDSDPVPFLNRYKNSIYFDDLLSGEIIEALKQQGLYDNTVIIVTGDHGQEFNETGENFWGHNGNFSRYQVQVPLLIKWPGKPAQQYQHRSSHLDLVPTLMDEYFKCRNPIADYSNGRSLFDTSARDYIVTSSWSRYALIGAGQTTVYHNYGAVDYFDRDYVAIDQPANVSQRALNLLEDMARFRR